MRSAPRARRLPRFPPGCERSSKLRGHAPSNRCLSVSHNKIGDVLVAQGDGPGRWRPTARAWRSARRWPRAIRPTPSGSATSRSATTGSATCWWRRAIGPGALAAYRNGPGDRARRWPRAIRRNTEWQRDLSVSHNKIGDVLVAQGDRPGRWPPTARASRSARRWPRAIRPTPSGSATSRSATTRSATCWWRRATWPGRWPPTATSLAIAEALAARDPANTEWQRDLSVSHDRIGDVLVAQGDGPGRWPPTATGLAIREALAARDPANTEWQRDLSVSHNKIGDVLVAQGDWPGRWPPTATSLAIARGAGRARSGQHRVAARPLGQPRQDRRRAGGAGRSAPGRWPPTATSLAIAERLAARDPANTQWQRDLTGTCRAI